MNETVIEKDIEIDKNHIDNFQLESSTGTKKMKEKFYKNAASERNAYIEKELVKFEKYKKQIYAIMDSRALSMTPKDVTSEYDAYRKKTKEFKKGLILANSTLTNEYKLGLSEAINNMINPDLSLEELNKILENFIVKFKDAGIELKLEDFSYSMFTKEYMFAFFDSVKKNNIKNIFNNIYWECPDFTKHLQLNLWFLLDKYNVEIKKYLDKKEVDTLAVLETSKDKISDVYKARISSLDIKIERDSCYNLNNFFTKKQIITNYVEGAQARDKNFNQFIVNNEFAHLSQEEKAKYYVDIIDLAHTLTVLKKFNYYKFIILDLQDKYSKREANKDLYNNKLKEISKEEKNRKKIFDKYLKAQGYGFFAKVNLDKQAAIKLEMNEEVLKLYTMYEELHDLEIVNNISLNLTNTSSLYDLLLVSFSSFHYLEKSFREHFKDKTDFVLHDTLNDYFDFIYSPYNGFLDKINAFVNYNVTDIVSDKYRLLGLNLSSDMINEDNLDATIDSVNYIKLIKRIDEGILSLNEMKFIIDFKDLEPIDVSS